MTIIQLRRLHRAEPFVPFALRLKDGTRMVLRTRTVLAHGGGSQIAVFAGPDDFRMIRRADVVAVEIGESNARM